MIKIQLKDYMENNRRFEKKFFISELTKHEIENIIMLHPAVFSEIYYERFVNNIYLDFFDLQNYFDNLAGISERKKVRIRWYGNLFGQIECPILEIKIKANDLSYKVSYPLIGFSFDKSFTIETLKNVFIESKLPQDLKEELLCLQTSSLNRYKRKYFQSKNKAFRFTIDSQISFYSLLAQWNNFLDKRVDQKNIVLELKYDGKQKEGTVDFITNFLPCRVTKSSKYAIGVETLNPW